MIPRREAGLLGLVILVVVGVLSVSLSPEEALTDWVRTNAPANTDTDQKLVELAEKICAADPGDRYAIPRHGLPDAFVPAAIDLYCPD